MQDKDPKKLSPKINLIIYIYISILILGLAVAFYTGGIKPFTRSLQENKWQEISCKILHSDLHQMQVNSVRNVGNKCYLGIDYEYNFGGQTISSYSHNLYDIDIMNKCDDDTFLKNKYIVGKSYPCYINTQNPSEVTLDRKSDYNNSLSNTVIFFGGIIGLSFMLVRYYKLNKKKASGDSNNPDV